jgi:phosphatidylinositol alpha-1,6-mannosyltransferase
MTERAASTGSAIWMVSRVFAPDEGGVQTYAREVGSAYAELGWTVTMFVQSSIGPRQAQQGDNRLIDVGPGSRLGVYAKLARALREAWKTMPRPQAIHACTWRAAIPALPFDVPLIVTVHGREIGRPRGAAFRLMRFVLERATRIVAVSETTRALLLERLPQLADKIVVVWNGTAPAPARPAPTIFARGVGPAQVLTVCRLVPRKNIGGALMAVASTLYDGHRLDYAIVGRGEQLEQLQDRIDHMAMGSQVQLLGYVDDILLERLQAEADIFLHPQIALEDGREIEGFGISVADAMARGLVCIVGKDGGPSEFIRDGETGFVVDGRSVEAIHDALTALLSDRALCAAVGERARRWAADNLSWQRHGLICLGAIAVPSRLFCPGPARAAA